MKRTARELLTKALNRFGYDLVPLKERAHPIDFTDEELALFHRVKSYTMTGELAVINLIRAVEHVVKYRVPGDIVECGVWKGGSMMAIAATLQRLRDIRPLWLYDTYEGMPPATDVDRNFKGELAEDRRKVMGDGWVLGRLDEVQSTMGTLGYEGDTRYIKGLVEDTIPAQCPGRISLLRLDTDFYASTYHELVHLYPRLSPGGVLIIDDYGSWEGARKAVDQYFAEQSIPIYLSRVNGSCRLWVKPYCESSRA